MNAEVQYLEILKELVYQKEKHENRTGVDTYKIPPRSIQHDMTDGFPILTTKKVAWKTLRVELEGFIKGITSKKWFQERGCKIWDEWCNPQKVPYSTDPEVQKLMKEEDDLGPCIYGAAWRNFHDPEATRLDDIGVDENSYVQWKESHVGQKIDQLANIVDTLKNNPSDRRMICLAWNPLGLKHTALPACHYSWQVLVRGNKLDLIWNQRSCDWFLGVPFNIASYALLLHLLALESGYEAGTLTGNFADVHLYENHKDQAKEQLVRGLKKLPEVKTEDFTSIFDWEYKQSYLIGYDPHKAIKASVAV